ncbi:hypothetical protein AB0B89_31075 [Sphaerisporangium sp. NPDC049002]|uniref:hypothetical protein n=1 Tax=Sphaerisporangium sp. NPDC049002 TaxID=3155392 RepID=UPI0033D6CE21
MSAQFTPEQKQAARLASMEAEIAAAAELAVSQAPPPSASQLALLARLCAAHPTPWLIKEPRRAS